MSVYGRYNNKRHTSLSDIVEIILETTKCLFMAHIDALVLNYTIPCYNITWHGIVIL